ncbi:GH25 family lysozyme [Kocuria rosea]|uniref:GH25 family lysozyme n=1 Tax=Kocuria rosea TaxID=1275 RepID=UPI003D3268A7
MGMRPVAETFKETQFFKDDLTQYNYGAGHGAIDYATPIGTPVVANADGVVTFADWCWNLPGESWESRYYQIKAPLGNMRVGGGILVTIDHGAGVTAYVTVSAHLSKTDLNPGQRVRKGQIIGYTGNTGSSTGPHLHFALLWKPFAWGNGYYGGIDPLPFVRERFAILGVTPVVEDRKTTSEGFLHGIDVSAYQPADIVRKVKSDLVIVKTTEAAGWKSDRWERQLADARAAGKRVGVYHFARPMQNSSDVEANFFYNTVKHRDGKDLVWFLDWEEEGAYAYTAWARDFMARLDRLTGKQTGLYANTQALTGGVWSTADKARPLWRAYPVLKGTGYATSFNLPAPPSGWKKLVMDQYSFHGRLPGYAADLDLNVYYGGIPQWGAFGSAASNTNKLNDLEAYIMSTPEKTLETVVRRALDIHDKYKRETLGPVQKDVSLMDQILWLPSDFKDLRDRQDRTDAAVREVDSKLDTLIGLLTAQAPTTTKEG